MRNAEQRAHAELTHRRLVEDGELETGAGEAGPAALDEAFRIQHIGRLRNQFAGEFDTRGDGGLGGPGSLRPVGRTAHDDFGQRHLLVGLQRCAIRVHAPAAQPCPQQHRRRVGSGQRRAGGIERQACRPGRQVLGGQRGTGLFERGGAILGRHLASAKQDHPHHALAPRHEAFEQLPGFAGEARDLGRFDQHWLEIGGHCVLIDDPDDDGSGVTGSGGGGIGKSDLHAGSGC